jgi:hypothetical protein
VSGKRDPLVPLIEGLTAEVRRVGDRLELQSVALPAEPRHREAIKYPRKFNLLTFQRAVPGLFADWDGLRRQVPEEFVSHDTDEDGRPVAVVACPCGETPAVPVAGLQACNCRRVFANIGHDDVRVYRPPPFTDEEFG